MSDLTPEALDRIEGLAKEATPGPWDAHPMGSEGYAVTDIGTPNALHPRDRMWKRVARCGHLDWPTDRANAEFIAAANPATVRALIAEVRRMRADWLREATSRDELLAEVEERREAERAFSAALGWGDGKTEPSATLSDLVDPLKEALSAASDHDECNVCCNLCGEMLAGTQCPQCHGSGCLPNNALAYLECDQCAGVGKIHDGCAS